MPFQLFSLPQSVYTDIINSMNPCEQFFTSLCSRNAYSIIKTHRQQIKNSRLCTKGNFEFHFDDSSTTYLIFRQSCRSPNRDLRQLVIRGFSIQYELREDHVVLSYWTEPLEGTIDLIEYVGDLFNIQVETMEIYWNSGDCLMNWVQDSQPLLRKFRFVSIDNEEKFSVDRLTSLITLCEAKSLVLDAYTTEPLQPFHKKCDYFTASARTGITVDHLMTLDCIFIRIEQKQFSNQEINRFIKHWISGGSPRLKFFEVPLENYNEQELRAGIDGKWSKRKLRKRDDFYKRFLAFDGFFEIQETINGMSSGFKFQHGKVIFTAWPCYFPFFRLPHLASINIINAMNTTEQLLTSLCSRRAFSVIKTLRRGPNDIIMKARDRTLIIADGDERLIFFQLAINSCRKEIVTVNGHPTYLSYTMKKATIKTFWEERVNGTKELIEHVSSLFGTHVDKVTIGHHSGTEFIKWVQQRQKFLRMVKVTSDGLKENKFEPEDLKNIILSCQSKNIQLNVLLSTPFEIQELHKRFKVFQCLRGTWITVNNLMTLDCIEIRVGEKRFTCAEMNIFIKHWVNGGSPRLRILRVSVTEQNDVELLDGLDAQWNNEKTLVYNHRQHNGFFEVVRSDGITGGFKFFTNSFRFGVWPIDNRILYDLNSI